MCGLVGTFGYNLVKTDVDQFGFLLNIDVIRGYDSTGVAVAREKGKAKIIKGTFLPPDLLSLESYRKLTQYENANSITALIGHNRAATRGKVEQRNAHPFSYGHITLVHNGTANLHSSLVLDDKEFVVDSEAICYGIWKHGIDKVYSAIDGALTVVWWDNSEKALYFLSNGQRPFHYVKNKQDNQIYWASEKWMLDAMSSKFHVTVDDIYKPNKHFLFKWTLDKSKPACKLVQETRELKPAPEKVYTHAYVVHHHQNNRNVGRGNGYFGYPSGDKFNQTPLLGQNSDVLNTIRGWGLTKCFNHFKTVYDFNKEMGECALCGDTLMYSTSYMVDNTDMKTGFCGDCVSICLKEGEDPCVVQSLK